MLVLKVGFPQGSSVTWQKCRFSGSRRAVFITPHVQGMPMLSGGGETPKSNLLSRWGQLVRAREPWGCKQGGSCFLERGLKPEAGGAPSPRSLIVKTRGRLGCAQAEEQEPGVGREKWLLWGEVRGASALMGGEEEPQHGLRPVTTTAVGTAGVSRCASPTPPSSHCVHTC